MGKLWNWFKYSQSPQSKTRTKAKPATPRGVEEAPYAVGEFNEDKAWYVFYIPEGRLPKSFGGTSGWDWPKAYGGPYENRAAAASAVKRKMREFNESANHFKILNVTPQEFYSLWGSPPQSGFAP